MTNMRKILTTFAILLGILLAGSGLMAQDLPGVGPVEEPHGYPAWFADSSGLKLELCIDPETDPLLNTCANDPVDTGIPWSVTTGFGGEAFWLLAGSAIDEDTPNNIGNIPPSNGLVEAGLTLALEAAYGGDESIANGNQVSFGRVRVRMDVNISGTYRVTHPYGQIVFENVDASDAGEDRDVNYTGDVGGANILNPALAFVDTLQSPIMNPDGVNPPGPTTFITSPAFAGNPNAHLRTVGGTEYQYIADPFATSTIVGSPNGNNLFRVERLTGVDTWTVVGETNLFNLNGRVFAEREITPMVDYGTPPTKNLAAVGPVNRTTPYNPASTANITGALVPGYPIGYPLWYQDQSGLKLTITFPPRGISDPIDVGGPWPLNTAGETFYWSASADFSNVAGAAALDPLVEFAMEGTFAGDESVVDGFQMTFARMRIRIDTPSTGTYTITHPYGSKEFVIGAADLGDGINYTADIGNVNLNDPDSSFNGALYGTTGPKFLTWDTFNPKPSLNDPLLQVINPDDPDGPKLQYVGIAGYTDPDTGFSGHKIKNGPNGNIVRIQGPGIDIQTDLFDVTGQVFSGQNFGFIPAVNLLLLDE